tara:strand:- start:10158 stop:11252 length:1095 start_codon:yes stop_codon:yes gene_type:complete
MKRNLLFASALSLFCITANAQITINSTDVVDFGERVINGIDATSTVSIGGSGANQTWNFSSLNVDETDTMDFTNPVWYGLDNPFGAQMVIISSRDDSSFIYITKTSTQLLMNGIKQILGNGDTVNIPVNSSILPFPATYGMSGTWTANFEIFTVPIGFDPDGPGPHPVVDSLKFTRHTDGSSSADAWGDITTPLGTFASLRQNNVEYNVDTTWMYASGQWSVISPTASAVFQIPPVSYDTVRTVRWWSNDPSARFPVVEFEYDQNGNNNGTVKWLKASPTTSVAELNTFTANLYPNPTEGEINITSDEEISSVKIFDITGKVVERYNFTHKNTVNINTDLPAGIYLVKITNASGQNKIQKLTIH